MATQVKTLNGRPDSHTRHLIQPHLDSAPRAYTVIMLMLAGPAVCSAVDVEQNDGFSGAPGIQADFSCCGSPPVFACLADVVPVLEQPALFAPLEGNFGNVCKACCAGRPPGRVVRVREEDDQVKVEFSELVGWVPHQGHHNVLALYDRSSLEMTNCAVMGDASQVDKNIQNVRWAQLELQSLGIAGELLRSFGQRQGKFEFRVTFQPVRLQLRKTQRVVLARRGLYAVFSTRQATDLSSNLSPQPLPLVDRWHVAPSHGLQGLSRMARLKAAAGPEAGGQAAGPMTADGLAAVLVARMLLAEGCEDPGGRASPVAWLGHRQLVVRQDNLQGDAIRFPQRLRQADHRAWQGQMDEVSRLASCPSGLCTSTEASNHKITSQKLLATWFNQGVPATSDQGRWRSKPGPAILTWLGRVVMGTKAMS